VVKYFFDTFKVFHNFTVVLEMHLTFGLHLGIMVTYLFIFSSPLFLCDGWCLFYLCCLMFVHVDGFADLQALPGGLDTVLQAQVGTAVGVGVSVTIQTELVTNVSLLSVVVPSATVPVLLP